MMQTEALPPSWVTLTSSVLPESSINKDDHVYNQFGMEINVHFFLKGQLHPPHVMCSLSYDCFRSELDRAQAKKGCMKPSQWRKLSGKRQTHPGG